MPDQYTDADILVEVIAEIDDLVDFSVESEFLVEPLEVPGWMR